MSLKRVLLGKRSDGPVEDEVLRSLAQKLIHAEGELAHPAVALDGVELPLHHLELAIDIR